MFNVYGTPAFLYLWQKLLSLINGRAWALRGARYY